MKPINVLVCVGIFIHILNLSDLDWPLCDYVYSTPIPVGPCGTIQHLPVEEFPQVLRKSCIFTEQRQ